MNHPNDDTGDVLRRLEAKGDDLTKPRDIDFSVVFRSMKDSEQFAAELKARGCKVLVENIEDSSDFPWDVTVTRSMMADHAAITNFETELQGLADVHNGHNDGWGCFTQN